MTRTKCLKILTDYAEHHPDWIVVHFKDKYRYLLPDKMYGKNTIVREKASVSDLLCSLEIGEGTEYDFISSDCQLRELVRNIQKGILTETWIEYPDTKTEYETWKESPESRKISPMASLWMMAAMSCAANIESSKIYKI